jgi:hypothetical protein
MVVWYRYPGSAWECFFSFTTGHTYSRPAEWIRNAETMMAGRGREDALWRKNDEAARRLIWC